MPTTVAYLVEEVIQHFNTEDQSGAAVLRDFIKLNPNLADTNVYLPGENEYQIWDHCFHSRKVVRDNGDVALFIYKIINGVTKAVGPYNEYRIPSIAYSALAFYIERTDKSDAIYHIEVFKEVHDEFHEEIDSESLMRWEARKDDKREHDNLEGHLKLFLANYY